MSTDRVPEALNTIHTAARRIGGMVDQWVLMADSERRFHHRADDRQIDEMLELLLRQSLLFGEDDSSADD